MIPRVRSASAMCRKNTSINKLLIESNKYFNQLRIIERFSEIFKIAKTVIWENNYQDLLYIPHILKNKYNLKIVACPQNIEALVPGDMEGWIGHDRYDFLRQEMESFAICDEVFTISEEDQWIFNLLGIGAKLLPNYPSSELVETSLELRKKRKSTKQDDFFLILGTVKNPPTLIGTTKLLEDLAQLNAANSFRFKIAGFGTEIFSDQFENVNGFEILGGLEQGALDNLIQECKAMIINQEYCPGALTKVPEMLISGVPIIMNSGASRSYKRVDGVYVYDSISKLNHYLNLSFKMPLMPEKPVDEIQTFLRTVNGY